MKDMKELSSTAIEMIDTSHKLSTVKDRDEIIKVISKNKMPISEAMLDFQEKYGGLSYKFSELSNKGYIFDLFYYDRDFKSYELRYCQKYEG